MIKRLKNFILRTMATAVLLVPAVPATVLAAQDTGGIDDGLCSGAQLTVRQSQDCEAEADGDAEALDNVIRMAINTFSLIVGIISVIMIIVGGLKYITSGGEGTNIQGAKNTIMYAIIGLVVVALAQVVVRFVLSQTSEAGTL
jgi:cytochrome bd-type quinol oxidase subunit 2